MAESEEILISSLRNLGIEIPAQINSIKDLDSSSFFSISSLSLHLLLHNTTDTSSFPTSLPDSMAEKVNSCTHMASLFEKLEYPFEISFHQNIYVAYGSSYDVRPISDQLISSTWSEKTAEAEPLFNPNNQKVRSEDDPQGSSNHSAEVPSFENIPIYEKLDVEAKASKVDEQETVACTRELITKGAQVEKTTVVTDSFIPEQESKSCEEFSPELRCMLESICDPEKATEKDLELHHLEEEHELLKEAVRMAHDNEHSFSSYVDQLSKQIAVRQGSLQELENHWDIERKSLEEKEWNYLESLCVDKPDCQLKLQNLKEIDREIHSVLSEIKKREGECAKLESDMKKQPKVASRRSYIERINEITKNSRKLDTDVDRILKETRELKLESNSVEERLHRTYAVVDETILREAKKDPVGRQAYRLLTNIHESFEKIREQIFATDKAQREVAELEVKLTAIASRNLDRDKLQSDLDAMRRENEHLEKTLSNR
ncbi:hypothetical protein SOVF_128210 isoform B [Spinacia oleracea]|nr:hypothetical protein SOVF_128210 isoform B [Spinacia oleracea]